MIDKRGLKNDDNDDDDSALSDAPSSISDWEIDDKVNGSKILSADHGSLTAHLDQKPSSTNTCKGRHEGTECQRLENER